jgi:hypothetical protein
MLYCGKDFVMDCFPRLKVCKASFINSYKRIATLDKEGKLCHAIQNCKIVVDPVNKIISIESIKNICRFDELFADYGDLFVI